MKNLFKKLLASCLVVCMVLTLCVGAITVNAENPTGTVVAGTVTVDSGEGTAVVPVEVSAGVAASKVSVKVPANLTITALTLDTADEDVDVTYASAAEPNGKPISLVEATEFVAPYVDAEGVFSYIIHAPAGEVTTAPVIVKISFTGTFVENAEGILVDVEAQAAPDAVVLFDLTVTDGKIIVKAAHVCAAARTEQENVNQATCYAEGSYDEVVYCSCGKELSRTPKTIDKIAHTPAEAVEENRVEAKPGVAGSYDSVVYCAVEACKAEISRTPVEIPALPVEPTCKHANKTFVKVAKVATAEENGALLFHCADCDEDVPCDVVFDSSITTFVTPAISCEATTILRVKTAKTTGLSQYTNGVLVTTHNYQNGATADVDSYALSEVPVVSSRYQLDIPVIYTQFTDTFECDLYLEKDGVWYFNGGAEYTLKDVAMLYINADTTAPANRYAAANLLKVGAAAQTEFGYAKNNLADSELEGCEFVENKVPSMSCVDGVNYSELPSDYETAGKVFYITPGVVLDNTIAITLKANKAYYTGGTQLDNLRLVYSYTKENGTKIPATELTEYTVDNRGRFLFTVGVDAPDMRSVITFELYDGDTKVADDVVYSIEGALAAYYNSGSYKNVIERVMIYSDVVAKYF